MITTMKNKVQLVGHIGQDPDMRTVGNGKQMLRLSVATNERFRAAEGEWKEDTQWHPVVAWGKLAERLAAQVRKGSGLVIEGRLVHRGYEAKDGTRRISTEILLTDYQLLAGKAVPAESLA